MEKSKVSKIMTKETEEIKFVKVTFRCLFCENAWEETWDTGVGKNHFNVTGCRKCSVSTSAKKGTKIVYGAPNRSPSDAVYANFHLKPNEIYTVKKTKPWQHGCFVILEEFPNCEFNLRIFTPLNFRFEVDG